MKKGANPFGAKPSLTIINLPIRTFATYRQPAVFTSAWTLTRVRGTLSSCLSLTRAPQLDRCAHHAAEGLKGSVTWTHASLTQTSIIVVIQ